MSLLEIIRAVRRHLEESGRLSYRMLRREFSLDDDTLAEIVEELVDIQRVAVREDNALAWLAAAVPSQGRVGVSPSPPERDPRSYTPQHLADKILYSKAALEGERKQVTVLFSDVSGFTAMSEKLDPEDVHAIMDGAFEVILHEVHRYEGTINQFLGDGVMALFGAPVANEDHAHRALIAALAIQSGLQPLADEVRQMHGGEFRMRMGINTGLVVVGAIGRDLRMDYTAVGDTTNLAARLLGLAKPGQVVVSQRTRQLSAGFFVFEDLGDFRVKGKVEPVRAYAVCSEISDQTRLEVSRERGLTPLVGREQEISVLAGLHRRAADGQGAIALLVGDPGVGKSRLLYEFLHRIEVEGGLELKTTCASYGHSMAYRPIVALLRRYLGLSEGISGDEIRSRVAEQLQFLDLEGEERSILLAHFLGVSAPPEFLNRLSSSQLKARLLDVLRDVFLGASELAPLILIVENMHWIDSASEEFLAHLALGLPGHHVLLVLTTRPGYAATWLAAPLAQTLTLEGLDASDVRGMVQTLLAATEVAEQLFKLLADKSEGNPLYVEEILRQLQETGRIAVENGKARLSRADVTVPATIHDIIAARVDRLAEPLKQTLQGASVVGRRFSVALLSRVLQVVPDQVAGHLRDLHALDFILPSAQDPQLMYSFKHALTQDVVYEGVLERRRRRYHTAAGLGLEELYAGRTDEVMELLAYHFGRSAEAEKAVDFTILAAGKAQRGWANTEALAYFETALRRLETMPDTEPNRLRRIDAVVKQAETMFALGRHAEHVKALEAIRPLTEGADPPRRAAWLSWAGFLHSLTGTRPEVSIGYCREAAALADAEGLDDMRAFAECCLAHVCLAAGDLHSGLKAGEWALGVFEMRGNLWWACRTFWALIPLANALGDYHRALDYCARALAHATTMDDPRLKVVAHMRRGSTEIQRGDVERGLRACQQATALSAGPFDAMMLKAMRAAGLMKTIDIEGGVAELAEAVAWFERAGLHYTRAVYGLRLADGYGHLGDRARARALAEEVLVATRERGYRHLEGRAERALGESLSSEDPSAAAEHLDTAARILADVGARSDLAEVWVAQADLREKAGNVVGTQTLLERALAVFEELGMLDEAAHTRAALLKLSSPAWWPRAISRPRTAGGPTASIL